MASTTRKSAHREEQPAPRLQVILRPKNLIPGLNPEYVLGTFPASIGRHPSNDVELPFDAISRYHARIEIEGGKAQIVDLHSSNGTFVNSKRVRQAAIRDNDTLSFGSLEFALLMQEPELEANVAAKAGEQTTNSVHFIQNDSVLRTVYHAELPEDSSHAAVIEEEITNEEQLKKARKRLMTLYRLQDLLRSDKDEERVLRGVLALLFEVLPVDRGVALTREAENPSIFRPLAIKTKQGHQEKIGISKTILQRCLREKVAILTRDATKDSRFEESESILANSMRSIMCVPLISQRHVFGFLHLDTTDAVRSFSQEDLAFVANVGCEVAIHLHNMRMLHDKIVSERMAAIGQTITGMAHNIKNILVLTQGGIEMMEKRLQRRNYESVEENWLVVRRGLDRINRLVQDMLDYSRARTVQKRRTQINELLDDLAATFKDEFAARGIEADLQLETKLPKLMLDQDGLEKSITNLVLNAVEACPEGSGRITFRTRIDDESNVIIEIEDNAGGIPKEVLPRIFVPFFTTKGSKGSGLGLAMTRKFIEDMGGRIDVHSVEGEGTKFVITLYTAAPSPKIGDSTGSGEGKANESKARK